MKATCFRVLQVLLLLICTAHLVFGLGLNFSTEFPKSLAGWYGVNDMDNWTTPQFSYILRPIGAYMVVMGILTAVAAINPRRHSLIIFGLSVLLLMRAAQRLIFQEEIAEAFGIGTARNVTNMLFFAGMGVALLVLRVLAGSKPAS